MPHFSLFLKGGISMTDTTKTLSKPFPTTGELFCYKVDDLLYGWLYCETEYDYDNRQYFITNSKRLALMRDFRRNLGGMTARTAGRHFDTLVDKRLVAWDEKNDRWLFNPDGLPNPYKLVEKDMLRLLLTTYSQNAIRIYVYLLNWYHYGKSKSKNYIFTYGEIAQRALGYTESFARNSVAIETVQIILEAFARSGLIKYSDVYQPSPDGNLMVKRKALEFVAESKKDLPDISTIVVEKKIAKEDTITLEEIEQAAEEVPQKGWFDFEIQLS